jgi:coenzyme PQQ precursor peptide PqqA
MTWKTPRIVEVQVGMEINMYACAEPTWRMLLGGFRAP